MNKVRKHWVASLALTLSVALLASSFIVTNGIGLKGEPKAASVGTQQSGTTSNATASTVLSGDDRRMAGDIANMTGVNIDVIARLKGEGKSWNDVLDQLKATTTPPSGKADLLSPQGLDKAFVATLKKEGFSDTAISEASMIAERVLFELQEITSQSAATASPAADAVAVGEEPQSSVAPVATPSDDGTTAAEDISAYRELLAKIDEKTAVYLSLKLQKDFGGVQQTFDEYLLALQLGIHLETEHNA